VRTPESDAVKTAMGAARRRLHKPEVRVSREDRAQERLVRDTAVIDRQQPGTPVTATDLVSSVSIVSLLP
jgi:hypothetical protein